MRVVLPAVFAVVLAMSTPSAAETLPPTGLPEVDAAIRDERFAEALPGVLAALERATGDEARGLLLCTAANLKAASGELEGAVAFLRGAPWPAAPVPRLGVALTYVQLLRRYRAFFAHELRGRDAVDGVLPAEVKQWSEAQLQAEAWRVLGEAWSRRAALKDAPASAAPWLRPSGYPSGVRSHLRDALGYLVTEVLEDRALWSPGQDEEIAALPLAAWAEGTSSGWNGALGADGAHPLAAANGVLADLEAWHLGAGRAEPALEAARRRMLLLHGAAERDAQVRIRAVLEVRAGRAGEVPWRAVALDSVAEMLEGEGDLAAAWKLVDGCARSGPASVGKQRCSARAQRLAHPELSLEAMVQDGPGRRSLAVEYRNAQRVYFRAWRVPEEEVLRWYLSPGGQPSGAQLSAQAQGTPAAEWKVEVEDPGDRHRHRAQVVPPLTASGHYVVHASLAPGFSPPEAVQAVVLSVAPWVLVREASDQDGRLRIRAVSGASGAGEPGVNVEAWAVNWNGPASPRGAARTDSAGLALLNAPTDDSVVVVGRRGTELSVLPRQWADRPYNGEPLAQALVSTDRAAYRPGQKLLWKVVAVGGKGEAKKALAAARVVVHLKDARGNKVAELSGKTNRWGSLSGAFDLPQGRMLGRWSLRAEVENPKGEGTSTFRVEEYKRPTFEVELEAPTGEPVLGREVELKAAGRYLFGLPVTGGTYRWKVYREPRYPRWWWSWEPRVPPQLVATGGGALDPAQKDGGISIRFSPAEPPGSAQGVAWDFRVEVEITDEGGETRSGERHLLLGREATRIELELPVDLALSGAPVQGVKALRTTLGGDPRPGESRWELVRLQAPASPALPGDLTTRLAKQPHKRLAGDDTRGARWDALPGWQVQVAGWAEGAVLARGALTHDVKGVATLALPALEPGVYALKVLAEGKDVLLARHLLPVAGAGLPAPVAFWMQAEQQSASVGQAVKVALAAGWADQPLYVEIRRRSGVERRVLKGNQGVLELALTAQDRGNLRVSAWTVRDHQWLSAEVTVLVPWEDKRLQVSLESFRDTLEPGQQETWQVRVTGPAGKKDGAPAELLALMYDRALDAIAAHSVPAGTGLWPSLSWTQGAASPFGRHTGGPLAWQRRPVDTVPGLGTEDAVRMLDTMVWGGRGGGRMARRGMVGMAAEGAPPPVAMSAPPGAPPPPPAPAGRAAPSAAAADKEARAAPVGGAPGAPTPVVPRQNFAETAFFQPHLETDAQGRASIRFTVPESVTGWRLHVQAFDSDLRGGSLRADARTVKRLMVRSYLPRFLREGDEVELRFVVQNNSDAPLSGEFTLALQESSTLADAGARFGLASAREPVKLEAGASTTVRRRLKVPMGVGSLRVTAKVQAGSTGDGEQRELPLLPSRLRLSQSRTAVLDGKGSRALRFEELLSGTDGTRKTEQLAVTVDGQLFQAVLEAVPYLVEYPYECTEQTLNRYVSTAILAGTFRRYPAVAAWAKEAAQKRGDKPLERFDGKDANRAILFEESPWLRESGGSEAPAGTRLRRVLDPVVAEQDRVQALAKLEAAQLPAGGFPWFAGGNPSVFLTSYVLQGFARAAGAGVPVPERMVAKAWGWLAGELERREQGGLEDDVFLNFVATAYPDVDGYHPLLARAKRLERAERHFQQWRTYSKRVRALLALTLHRLGRTADARTVFASVMDGAKTDPLLGTYWAAEDRSWMWFNDTTETHATAMRVLLELDPSDARLPGLAQWLMLDKKLGHWKSTRATAEAVEALAHYLDTRGELGVDQAVSVKVGDTARRFDFKASSGDRRQQWVLPGGEVGPKSGDVAVENLGKGVTVATATWRFTTDTSPASGEGDLLSVTRRYFRRELRGKEEVLVPLQPGDQLAVGDEVEEQLSLRARHAAEYVHLRAPRGAGFEPAVQASGWRWRSGLGFYEEVRDSAENLFLEQLPAGEYTLKLKLRVAAAGTFRVGPATLQSLYAPEFTAYSAGAELKVK